MLLPLSEELDELESLLVVTELLVSSHSQDFSDEDSEVVKPSCGTGLGSETMRACKPLPKSSVLRERLVERKRGKGNHPLSPAYLGHIDHGTHLYSFLSVSDLSGVSRYLTWSVIFDDRRCAMLRPPPAN